MLWPVRIIFKRTLCDRGSVLGKVDAFEIDGMDLWINSSDHIPPHFHASRPGEWEIRVMFLQCTEDNLVFEKKWAKKLLGRRDRERILAAALNHREALLREWERKVCGMNPTS
jgi:hypothetical protein